ncbi:spore germination protein [Pseudalkalibacillus caeni]|uniref:Spore germination protein n=1 Tax=Exobacillus caeni TaxID=2574798 RepID=A0A5R9FBU2_9BACL|nr:spore germination protein [Pseudalkalibacillus caeni]TLS37105.1 spore germination protein [Pseudalkalibacillus caeni]
MPIKIHRKRNKKLSKKERIQKEVSTFNIPDEMLSDSLKENVEQMKKVTGNSSDLKIRELKGNDFVNLTAVYIDGLVNNQFINEFIIETIFNNIEPYPDLEENKEDLFERIYAEVVASGEVQKFSNWKSVLQELMGGSTVLLVDGISTALVVDTRGGETRSVEEPGSQVSIRGPRDGFTESIQTNISLIRRRIQNPNLWVETMKIGKVTQTSVAMMYLNGIANEEIVNEVRKRLKSIDIDSILESGYIEQLIEDQTMTTFPTLFHTERPDSTAGNILEGRIAIIVDGTPFVLIAPAIFIQFFQAVEDYYARFDIATSIRFLRVLTFTISLVAPALYIAVTTFHQEMVPTRLIIAISAQRDAVPFPAFVEALLMEITFEILREAGIRLPRAVGSTVSIVGALVIGQAAVQAGIVSPAMVIIVSITAIASFSTPSYAIAISARLIRFLFMLSAATFGVYGIALVFIFMLVHLCSLRSFGVPYMAPIAPLSPSNLGDTIVRFPIWAFTQRPRLIGNKNNKREGPHQKPGPPQSRSLKTTADDQGDTS